MNGGSIGILCKSCNKVTSIKPCSILSKQNTNGLIYKRSSLGTKRNISTNYRDKKLLFKPLKEQQRQTLMMLLNPDGAKLRCEKLKKNYNFLRTEIFKTVICFLKYKKLASQISKNLFRIMRGRCLVFFNRFFGKKLFHI